MEVRSGGTSIQICGWNSGQHSKFSFYNKSQYIFFLQQSRLFLLGSKNQNLDKISHSIARLLDQLFST